MKCVETETSSTACGCPCSRWGLMLGWLAAVAAILAPELSLGIRLAGWLFAAWRVFKNPQEGLLLLAFFTPLFDNFGVVPIGFSLKPIAVPVSHGTSSLADVFFSVKPVQIIMLLLIGALCVRKKLFFKDPLDWLVVGSLIGILAISLIAGAYSEDPLKAFRVNVNFALLIVLCKVLMSMIDGKEIIWKILKYYFFGVVFLCLVHAANMAFGWMLFAQETRFNNHFGFLLSMSFPLGLCMLFTARNIAARLWYFGVLLLAFFCTVLTLSRSSLYGSVIGMAIFLGVFLARSGTLQRRRVYGLIGTAALLIVVPVILYESLPGITDATSLLGGKLSSFFRLLDWEYWRYAMFEDPNGGMFGRRFVQLREVQEIFTQHWLFGEGWTNRVISFHGLFYTVLTGTGLAGFLLFVYFLYRMFRTLWKIPRRDPDPATRVLAIALFCSLADWMLHCLLDTYFLQFHIWLILAMSLAYMKLILRSNDPEQPCKP